MREFMCKSSVEIKHAVGRTVPVGIRGVDIFVIIHVNVQRDFIDFSVVVEVITMIPSEPRRGGVVNEFHGYFLKVDIGVVEAVAV